MAHRPVREARGQIVIYNIACQVLWLKSIQWECIGVTLYIDTGVGGWVKREQGKLPFP